MSGDTGSLATTSVGVNIFAAAHEPETILRVRGEYAAYLDGAATPGIRVAVTAGLILVPEGTGTTVLWAPGDDPDAPWLWYDAATLAHEEMVIDVLAIPGMSYVRRVIDNKAMRITRNQEVQFVVQNVSLGTASSINATISGRILSGT